jgi:hypothetical protein
MLNQRRSRAHLTNAVKSIARENPVYPLQRRALIAGAIIGSVAGLMLWNALAGYALFVLAAIIGLLWRKEEPPVLVFCLCFQWLFIAVGYFYLLLTGAFPFQDFALGDLEGATFLSLLGLLAIIFGARLGIRLLARKSQTVSSQTNPPTAYDIRLLFWAVVCLYITNWFFEIFPRELAFNQAQLISTILSVRDIFLCLLLLSVFAQRTGYRYAIAAAIFVTLPQSISQHSAFSWIFIFIGVALLREWRPWLKLPQVRRRNRLIVAAASGIGIVLLFLALVWQGGVKDNWRYMLRVETSLSSPVDKLGALAVIIQKTYSNLEWADAAESLATRLCGTFYFSHTLLHVPRRVAHEDGALTQRAINHTLKPRFLFPDKPDLGSNSWLIWQYTGLPAAGEESETSIGLTYMAEFYVDYGRYLMFVALFGWGLLIGLIYGWILRRAPSLLMAGATVIVLFPQPFSSFEGEIAYLLGGLIQTTLVFVVLLHFLGPLVHRRLLHIDRLPARLRMARTTESPSVLESLCKAE